MNSQFPISIPQSAEPLTREQVWGVPDPPATDPAGDTNDPIWLDRDGEYDEPILHHRDTEDTEI